MMMMVLTLSVTMMSVRFVMMMVVMVTLTTGSAALGPLSNALSCLSPA